MQDISLIMEHTENSVKNPLPSKAKVWDYYIRDKMWWQRRYIISIHWKNCFYKSYALDDYKVVNGRLSDWVWIDPNWSPWYCTLSHIRAWSNS